MPILKSKINKNDQNSRSKALMQRCDCIMDGFIRGITISPKANVIPESDYIFAFYKYIIYKLKRKDDFFRVECKSGLSKLFF